jgi:hypothetical protein
LFLTEALRRRGDFSTGFIGLIGLRIFTATSLRQGYGGQEEHKERREKIVQSMNPILKILFILSKKLFVLFVLVMWVTTDQKALYGAIEVCRTSEYDTKQQVTGNHLLSAWETLEKHRGLNARFRV